ncbi:hypothetical protein HOY80DRAFT_1040089 [Tuber brumale]|nr:hypothetical protein HOY80DRAFT_1040089 [Tuber brumale]
MRAVVLRSVTTPFGHVLLGMSISVRIMRRGKLLADEWLKANQPSVSYRSDILRVYNPEMYISMVNSVRKATSGGLLGLASQWRVAPTRQGIGSGGGSDRQNWDNEPTLGYKVEVKRGNCFMFKGANIAHPTFSVTQGYRNFVDLFCYESLYEAARVRAEERFQERRREAAKKQEGGSTKRNELKQRIHAKRPKDGVY